ncbi:ERF family protein [Treponema pectinovorum]|uniref:ERF family protein n=1 Tax=Treponema pectinovorum TaxID=164 RepID=UPI0011CBC66C|nr:ERF family protein [Treponema pectinovorum]
MKQSEKTNDLLASLVKAQAEFTTLPKDKQGYGYKYTDFDTVVKSVRPILAKYNLAFTQTLTTIDGVKNAVTTRIFSDKGEYIEDTTLLPEIQLQKTNAAQNMGAAITYMKRYALCSMLGISSDEDVDGNIENVAKTSSQSNSAPKTENTGKEQNQKKPKMQFKGGESTEAEKARIKELLEAKYANGGEVFSRDEKLLYSSYRKDKYTASELIAFIENALRNRRFDAPELPKENQNASPAQKASEENEPAQGEIW